MKKFLLFIFLLTGLSSFAQDSLRVLRNEVSLDVSPALMALFGNENWLLSLSYKREMKDHPRVWLRGGFRVESAQNTAIPVAQLNYYEVFTTDSTSVRHYRYRWYEPKYEAHAGVELRSRERSGWTGFVALDLFGNRSGFRSKTTYRAVTYNSTGAQMSYTPPQPDEEYKLRYTNIGLLPRIGMRYAFSRHWAMALQAGLEVQLLEKYVDSRTPVSSWEADFGVPDAPAQLDVVYSF